MASVVLVRYGMIPEVSRFAVEEPIAVVRGDRVLIEAHRGQLLGTVLSEDRTAIKRPSFAGLSDGHDEPANPAEGLPRVIRRAASEDLKTEQQLRTDARAAFDSWCERIEQWELELELIDLEWTADRKKLILYVLNHRGPDCTKLALQAAAVGLGIIEVQPVSADGLVTVPDTSAGGGCGTCGSH